jgi:hypothetical protein
LEVKSTMKVLLLDIDSKLPNLALMKISAWHKAMGDQVFLNFPLCGSDKTYASCLYDKNKWKVPLDAFGGGPGFDYSISLPNEMEKTKPDYGLYPHFDFGLGYTYRHCPRKCPWCIVWRMPTNNDMTHHSIWEFHSSEFKKIMLLDNNLFASPYWRQTFEEIWDADLRVKEHGFDIRLLDEEKALALKKTKFLGQIHFAFDNPMDEDAVRKGVGLLKDAQINLNRVTFYVLCGFNTTPREDIDRIIILRELEVCAFIMKHKSHWSELHDFAYLVNTTKFYKKIDWKNYPEFKYEHHSRDFK